MPTESLGEKVTGESVGAEPREDFRQSVPPEEVHRAWLVSQGPACPQQGTGWEAHGSSGHMTLWRTPQGL